MLRTAIPLFPFLIGCLLVSGCGPASQPVWNTDSRSFFYTHTDGSVLQYDLDKDATRVLLPPGEQQPCQLALSPTLPFVACAQSALGPEGRAVQVGLASLVDGSMSWSNLEVWGDAKARRDVSAASCYWCPTGQRILIWYQQAGDVPGLIQSATPFGQFAVYDIKSRKLSELTTAPPAVILGQAIHASPLCPDGSGYLAMKLADQGPKFFFVSWDGWEYPLALAEEVVAILNLIGDTNAPNETRTRTFFPLPQGVWKENVLKFPTRSGAIAIDLKNRKITLEALTAAQQQEFDQMAEADTADAPWTTIQVVPFQKGEYALHCRQKIGSSSARVELVDNKARRRRVLLEGSLPENFLIHYLFPSPDGQLILVSLRDSQTKSSWIHVVQPDGKIQAKVDTGPVVAGGTHQTVSLFSTSRM